METKSFTLKFSDIVYDVVNNTTNQELSHMKRLIGGCSGVIKSGCITAVMGPSGSCKTTFLNFLVGRVQKGSRACGKVLFKNAPRNYNLWSKQYAYLEQDDYIVLGQTVYDFVKFSVSCRRTDMDNLTVETNINALMEKLHINHLRDIDVSSISGGERKRVMIAIEMAADAEVLILDEPTSGLDSNLALTLMYILKEYAVNQNKIVLMSIHQPGPGLFELIDNLFFFYNGAIMYDGAVSNLDKFFEENGFVCKNLFSKPELLFELFSEKTVFPDIRQLAGNVEKLKASVFKSQENKYGDVVLSGENVFDAFGMDFNMKHVLLILERTLKQGMRSMWRIFALIFVILLRVGISVVALFITLSVCVASSKFEYIAASMILFALENAGGFKLSSFVELWNEILKVFINSKSDEINISSFWRVIGLYRVLHLEFIKIPWVATYIYDLLFWYNFIASIGFCIFFGFINPFIEYIIHGAVKDEIRKNIYTVGSLFVATFIFFYSFAIVFSSVGFVIAAVVTKMWAVSKIAMIIGVSGLIALSLAFLMLILIVMRENIFFSSIICGIIASLVSDSFWSSRALFELYIKFNFENTSSMQYIEYVFKYLPFMSPFIMVIRVLCIFIPFNSDKNIRIDDNIVRLIDGNAAKTLVDKIVAYEFRTGLPVTFEANKDILSNMLKYKDNEVDLKIFLKTYIASVDEEKMAFSNGFTKGVFSCDLWKDQIEHKEIATYTCSEDVSMFKGFMRLILATEMPYACIYDILFYVMSLISFALFSYVLFCRQFKQENLTLLL